LADRLFFLATFHADVVFGLAGLRGVIFCTSLLLLAALLAAVRLFSLHRCDAAKEKHHDHSGGGSHDNLLSMQTTNLRKTLTWTYKLAGN
jgi:hypothetical protein